MSSKREDLLVTAERLYVPAGERGIQQCVQPFDCHYSKFP